MNRVPLPARVRLSRLVDPPTPGVLGALRRLQDSPLLSRIGEPGTVCVVVIAGGKVIGYCVRVEDEELLALESAWRGRGIEAALRQEAHAS